jgi:hypothetical protein
MLRSASSLAFIGSLRIRIVCGDFISAALSVGSATDEARSEEVPFSSVFLSPIGDRLYPGGRAPGTLGNTSAAVMAACDAYASLGGEEEVELKELCMKGLLERFEGLVLLELGPPAIASSIYVGEKNSGILYDAGGGDNDSESTRAG